MSRVVQYDAIGGPDVLRLGDRDVGEPKSGQVRLSVRAVGLNPFDAKARSGLVPFIDTPFPRGIGGDFAAVVTAVGAGSPWAVGDEVFGWSDSGALADDLIEPATNVAAKPVFVDWEVAATLSTSVQTAHHCLEVLGIRDDDTVLLSAAAGGVGMIFAQLAIARGAAVIGTASPANEERLRSIGVTPIGYGPGLADRVRRIAPSGITAVQDNAGRETIEAALELGVDPSRICSIVDHAAVAQLGLASPGRYEKSAALLERYGQEVALGRLRVDIDRVYPLIEVREAFRHLETRHLSGKIVVVP